MAKRKQNGKPGYGKLLDAWQAPRGAGDPVGCLATSFTFSPVFFEEECLGRFLQLETNPQEDGPLYLVEREEKLAQVRCAVALVDQNHCQGFRSLRWDLLPVRPKQGILHAKISLLQWNELVRLIIASANLTEDGYRRNREVFGVLDFKPGSDAPLDCLRDVLEFLREIIGQVDPGASVTGPASQRGLEFLDGVAAAAQDLDAERHPRLGHTTARAVFVGPGRPSALDSLSQLWPGGVRPVWARILSPFFDPPGADNVPAQQLWNVVKQRGEASVSYYVTAEPVSDEDGTIFLHAPESLLRAEPSGRAATETLFYQLTDEPARPLHAKAIWLEGQRWAAYMIGSSNFTSAGLGLGKRQNYEANLLYSVDANRDNAGFNALQQSFPAAELIDLDQDVRWQPRPDDEDTGDDGIVVLDAAFGPAVYRTDSDQRGFVRLVFSGDPPRDWRLNVEEQDATFFSEAAWEAKGRPAEVELPWLRELPPYGFEVRWHGTTGCAWWPVNVENASSLPPPEELRDIPLDVLISILTSARPLHIAMRRWVRKKRRSSGGEGDAVVIDPHKRVDTSAFLLQRTRRVSWALQALAERLSRPVATKEALAWRLSGPIGVEALAKALVKEARSPEESSFLLTELALELSRVRPKDAKGCLPPEEVKAAIRHVVECLREEVLHAEPSQFPNLKRYVDDAFREAIT